MRILKPSNTKNSRAGLSNMREGRAPSKELAGVFAQFKNWLTGIYKTIRGLGAPINDDIRGVFDRMLTDEPQHTVIAPENERQPTLAGYP
jgi:hypothetical protein